MTKDNVTPPSAFRASDDEKIIKLQLGRPLLTDCTVVHRCHLEMPVVSVASPIDRRGLPFPTRYWLSCPLANLRAGRLEAQGGVVKLERKRKDADFQDALDKAHVSYAAERDQSVDENATYLPKGGVGGAREGIKCLHAHLAHHLGGGENPIGKDVQEQIGELDCEVPCIAVDEAEVPKIFQKNPEWHREKI
ncbi:MAG: DUF501 domain-containing protein [Deltaproteobacteria bacterium]|nr:DUF501 domain-containing protein [Deltaproteobacteria bacterium]